MIRTCMLMKNLFKNSIKYLKKQNSIKYLKKQKSDSFY